MFELIIKSTLYIDRQFTYLQSFTKICVGTIKRAYNITGGNME